MPSMRPSGRPRVRTTATGRGSLVTPADLDEARHSVALIHARGFQRERDLSRDLEQLIAQGI